LRNDSHLSSSGMQARAMEEGDMQVQAALNGLVQLDAVDMLREALLTALEPKVSAFCQDWLCGNEIRGIMYFTNGASMNFATSSSMM
jgi:hypothetical protein